MAVTTPWMGLRSATAPTAASRSGPTATALSTTTSTITATPPDTSTNGRDGVYSNEGTSGNYYAANSIHDNGRTGSNYDHGLYLCGQNETVINNLLYRNASSGLQIAGYTTVSSMKVYNNVMAWNGRQGIILWMALERGGHQEQYHL